MMNFVSTFANRRRRRAEKRGAFVCAGMGKNRS